MAEKMTLRDRFAQYDFAECEQGATIEAHWTLIKSEPLSAQHAEKNPVMDDGRIILPNDAASEENSAAWTNFAAGQSYISEDGQLSFTCWYKLSSNGTKDGAPTYMFGMAKKGGIEHPVDGRTSEWLKNKLFGKGGWISQKGPRAGAVPTTRAEAKTMAEKWSAELLGHIEAVERILETYTGGTTMPDFSAARQICKVRAYRHSLTLLAEFKAQEEEHRAERQAKTTAKKADRLGEVSAADMLAILAAKGITLEQLMEAQK